MLNLNCKRGDPSSHSQQTEHRISGWQPSYLRSRMLIVFVVIFCAVIAALEAINHVSQVHNGIASSNESRHYLWTYGPTAIFTVIVAFWSRVEFQVKQRAPWKSMAEKPVAARESILLDYVSDIQLASMAKAIRNKHFDVAAGVTCSMLLRLLAIFSTALFSLQTTQVRLSSVPIQFSYIFSAKDVTFNAPGAQAFDILNRVLFENGTYPEGTNADLAFQHFSAPCIAPNAMVTAPVDGMMADLGCETASIDIKKWDVTDVAGHSHHSSTRKSNGVNLMTPSCTISNVALNSALGGVSPYVAKFASGQCDDSSAEDGMRIVVTLAEISLGKLARNTSTLTETDTTTEVILNRSVQLICNPTYSLVKLQAETNTSQSSSPVNLRRIGTERSALPILTAWDIAKAVLSDSSSHGSFARPNHNHNLFHATDDPFQNMTYVDVALQLGAQLTGITGDIKQLFEDGVLNNAASSYYRAMTAQLMNKGLTLRNQSTAVGHAIVHENRIVITQLSLRVMEVCLILGILLAVSMIFLGPRTTIAPWNPTSISSVATIMAKSNGICQSLRGTGTAPSDALNDSLKERRYYSELTPKGFLIKTEGEDIRSLDNQESHKPTWEPFPGLIARGVIFIAVALLIVALEIALHISRKNNGLGNVSSNEHQHYLWTILPSLVMASVGILFGRIDFNTRSLAPYEQLKQPTGALFKESMTVNYLDSLVTTNIIRSIRERHFAVLVTTLAPLVSSFLVIVASGLYSAIEVPHQISTNFTQETTFYRGNSADGNPIFGMVAAKEILQKNLTFPHWTYDELAFPELSMQVPLSTNETENLYVDIRMPALRAAPACYFQTGSQLQWNFSRVKYGTEPVYQLSVLAPSMPCSLADQDMGSTSSTSSPVLLKSQGLFGQSSMLACGTNFSANPATLYIWGNFQNDSVENISAMTCIEAAETVDTLTRFQLPGFDITDDHPPVPDESSARSAPNVDVPWISWNNPHTTDDIAENSDLDEFFTALVMGKYAIPAEDLVNPDSSDIIIKAINRQDRILRAQVFNNYSRSGTDGTLEHTSLPGNITLSNRLRLSQDAASTRVLEALLASTLVLGIVGSILMNTDHVLPKNPSSIAAVASLLADSNILTRYETVMGDPNGQSLGQDFFSQCRFFLGFWRDTSDQGDPWQISEDQVCEKYCIYLSERDGETISGNASMWARKEFRAKEISVEERMV
ncbi:hypothetical protein ACN42_g4914 [Penicillium freii]|uniref:Uncharacterized protein n=1 Tax=Penicillium freii TaxID=48697 RepID=A0A101MKD0_PENFR|nr:hypothetical protein ACN42_g4914 [Penicillium freii]